MVRLLVGIREGLCMHGSVLFKVRDVAKLGTQLWRPVTHLFGSGQPRNSVSKGKWACLGLDHRREGTAEHAKQGKKLGYLRAVS